MTGAAGDSYSEPVLLVQAGNRIDSPGRASPRFPASRVPSLRSHVAHLLLELAPTGLVTGGAAGSDLIVAGEAQRLGVPVHLVLARPPEAFRTESVADQGEAWIQEFDRVLAKAASVRVASHGSGCDPFLSTNDALLRRAQELAGDEPIVALAVRPRGGEQPPRVTDHIVARAEADGIEVVAVDPMIDRE
jgi:hypothetical protein